VRAELDDDPVRVGEVLSGGGHSSEDFNTGDPGAVPAPADGSCAIVTG